MQSLALRLSGALFLASCAATANTPEKPELWMQVQGSQAPTIVFISGNGHDSTVWSEVEAKVRQSGARTALYDRSGLGRSPLSPEPYSIDNEAEALKRALEANGVKGDIIFAAHSYGGLIAALATENNPAVEGIVLIDALLPADLSDDVVAGVLAEYTPRFAALEEAAPDLAKAVIPVVQAYPATAERMKSVSISSDLPVIDILAETTWVSAPEEVAHIRRAHAEFAAASPARKTVHAEGSSHNVMKDRPDIVIDAITEMIGAVRTASRDTVRGGRGAPRNSRDYRP